MKKLSVRGKDQFALRVSSGFNQGALITLSKKKSILGRSFKVSIPIEDERASREHTQIVNEGGKFIVSDMGSTNGTYLNNELLSGPRVLVPGDVIRIGSSIFRFETMHIKHSELAERWKNATSVIPRASFSFEELSKIQPDKHRFIKKQMKKLKMITNYVRNMSAKEIELHITKIELSLTKMFFRFQRVLQRFNLL
jgi:pSer/pThr/pTyr-binding forkhead associated (FHA) protein